MGSFDELPKTFWQLILTFMGVFMFVSIITFGIKSSMARTRLYETIEYIEVYGYDEDTITDFAHKSNTAINVLPLDVDDGYRYKVSVSFEHFFAIFNFSKSITYTATTRVVEY